MEAVRATRVDGDEDFRCTSTTNSLLFLYIFSTINDKNCVIFNQEKHGLMVILNALEAEQSMS